MKQRQFDLAARGRTLFPRMVDILPPGRVGNARITHFKWGRRKATDEMWRRLQPVDPGTFAQLSILERIGGMKSARWIGYMNDTLPERFSSVEFVEHAHGDVLIAGLGLGMVLFPVCAKPEVRRVLVVEKHPDVIALVGPHVAHLPRLEIVQGDIHQWEPAPGMTFDTIFWDILPAYIASSEFLAMCADIRTLWERYLNPRNPAARLFVWAEAEAREEMRQESGTEAIHAQAA